MIDLPAVGQLVHCWAPFILTKNILFNIIFRGKYFKRFLKYLDNDNYFTFDLTSVYGRKWLCLDFQVSVLQSSLDLADVAHSGDTLITLSRGTNCCFRALFWGDGSTGSILARTTWSSPDQSEVSIANHNQSELTCHSWH